MALKFRGSLGWLKSHPFLGSSDEHDGLAFVTTPKGQKLTVIFSSDHGTGWEHVSISTQTRTPTWEEMCFVKGLFWDAEETVIQLHPPESQWVNNHPHCLHLWRPTLAAVSLPPQILV